MFALTRAGSKIGTTCSPLPPLDPQRGERSEPSGKPNIDIATSRAAQGKAAGPLRPTLCWVSGRAFTTNAGAREASDWRRARPQHRDQRDCAKQGRRPPLPEHFAGVQGTLRVGSWLLRRKESCDGRNHTFKYYFANGATASRLFSRRVPPMVEYFLCFYFFHFIFGAFPATPREHEVVTSRVFVAHVCD